MAGMRGRRKAVSGSAKASTTTSVNRSRTRYATDVLEQEIKTRRRRDRENVSIYGVDPRGLTTAWTIPSRSAPSPTTTRSAPRTSRTSSGTRRTACADRRTRPADSPSSTGTTIAMRSRASCRTTAATTCSGTTRRTTSATAGSESIQVRVNQPGLKRAGAERLVAPRGKPEADEGGVEEGPRPRSCTTRCRARLPVSGLTLAAFAAPFRGHRAKRRHRDGNRDRRLQAAVQAEPRGPVHRAIWRSRCSRPTACRERSRMARETSST